MVARRGSPVLAGCAAAIIAVLAWTVGLFEPLERRTLDWRERHATSSHPPMSDAIVHVDIDDGALDHVGRWPDAWPRSRLALVIDELDRAGARTIVIDLILSEPSLDPAQDEAFAAAVGRARVVLPIVAVDGPGIGEAWLARGGPGALDRLLDAVAADLARPIEAVATDLGLDATLVELVGRRPLLYKLAAAWRRLRAMDPRPETFEVFERLMVPGLGELAGDHPERRVLEIAWSRDLAWRAAEGRVIGDGDGTGGSFADRSPLVTFTEAATRLGNAGVEGHRDHDGTVRTIEPVREVPAGHALQLGLAGVAAYLGTDAADIRIAPDRLVLGPAHLPLEHGDLRVAWPPSTTQPRWEGFLRRDSDDARAAGHISIRSVLEIGEARATHALNRERLADLTLRVLEFAGTTIEVSEALAPAQLAAAEDEVGFTLEDIDDATLADEDEAFRDHVHHCRLWRDTREALAEGDGAIAEAEATLGTMVDGKLVFVGWTATSAIADFVPTAMGARTPGVIVHAAIADMVLTGRSRRTLPGWAALVVVAGAGLLGTLLAARLRAGWSAAAIVLVGLALAGATIGMFAWLSVVMPLVAPPVAGSVAWITTTAYAGAMHRRERLRVQRQFRARVSPQLVEHLARHPDALSVAGHQKVVTVLFADLAGFTTIAESLGPARTVTTLNTALGSIADALIEHGAYVNKFLGDGVMAFWSAFEDDADQADRACHAALQCLAAIESLETTSAGTLHLRVGVATGPVIVGDCGAPPALNDYTVIGDAVNLAARLESANKQLGTGMLVDGTTREACADPALRFRPIGPVVVVGQSVAVDLYEIRRDADDDDSAALSESLVRAFRANDVDACRDAIRALAAHDANDPLVAIYEAAIDARASALMLTSK